MRKIMALFLILSMQCFAARSFNGTSDGAVTGNGSTQNWPLFNAAVSSMTISFWMWQDSFGNTDKLALEQTGNYNGTTGAFIVDTGGACGISNVFYFGQHQTGSAYRLRRFAQPSASVWHHYMFTMSSTSSNWNAYVDGVSQTLTNCDLGSPGTQTFPSGSGTGMCVMSRGCATTLFNGGKMAQLAVWESVILPANAAVSLASCMQPWEIQGESLSLYAPMWGVDSPEPSYSSIGRAHSLTSFVLAGTSFTPGPPICP